MRRLKELIERLLPWFDPAEEQAKDRRADEALKRTTAMRRSFRDMDDRLARRQR